MNMNIIQENKALEHSFVSSWPLVHGGEYQIRPINIQDRAAVLDLFDHLSLKSRYFRYAHAMSTLPEKLLDAIIHASTIDDFALVAIVKKMNEPERLIGISRYVKDDHGNNGEFSLSVSDDFHHEGIGSHLMRGLIDCARLNGLERIYGFVVKENHDMLVLMRHLNFSLETDEDDSKMYIVSHNCN